MRTISTNTRPNTSPPDPTLCVAARTLTFDCLLTGAVTGHQSQARTTRLSGERRPTTPHPRHFGLCDDDRGVLDRTEHERKGAMISIVFQYLAGHLGIVLAAFYLVVGLRIVP